MAGGGSILIELGWPAKALSPNARSLWSTDQIAFLRANYGKVSARELVSELGRGAAAIRNQAYKLKLTDPQPYSDELIADLRAAYEKAGIDGVLRLNELARKWDKTSPALCTAARRLGLSVNQSRRKVEQRKDHRKYGDKQAFLKVASQVAKDRIIANGHPRGFMGKRHSLETRDRIGMKSKQWWGSMSETERDERVTANLQAALAKNGKIGALSNNREGATWKAGWREIGDRRIYFRSRWEANYARYLQWLKERGDILEWEYEPETFWFDTIKRGVRSYKPDFRIHELNGAKPLHEVKGWMDARSKTTLKRMAKYHPHETIILVREKEMRAISRFAALIPDWESDVRKGRP